MLVFVFVEIAVFCCVGFGVAVGESVGFHPVSIKRLPGLFFLEDNGRCRVGDAGYLALINDIKTRIYLIQAVGEIG